VVAPVAIVPEGAELAMGFQMGGDDKPFSQRMWGLGRRVSPRPGARRGCMFVLIAAAVVLVAVLIIAVIAAAL
jgi:hypothetical protein